MYQYCCSLSGGGGGGVRVYGGRNKIWTPKCWENCHLASNLFRSFWLECVLEEFFSFNGFTSDLVRSNLKIIDKSYYKVCFIRYFIYVPVYTYTYTYTHICQNCNHRLPMTHHRLRQTNFRRPISNCDLVPITSFRLRQIYRSLLMKIIRTFVIYFQFSENTNFLGLSGNFNTRFLKIV